MPDLQPPTPTLYACPALTKIRFRLCVAWLSKDFGQVEHVQAEERNHKANCPVCSGESVNLCNQLWPNAVICCENSSSGE